MATFWGKKPDQSDAGVTAVLSVAPVTGKDATADHPRRLRADLGKLALPAVDNSKKEKRKAPKPNEFQIKMTPNKNEKILGMVMEPQRLTSQYEKIHERPQVISSNANTEVSESVQQKSQHDKLVVPQTIVQAEKIPLRQQDPIHKSREFVEPRFQLTETPKTPHIETEVSFNKPLQSNHSTTAPLQNKSIWTTGWSSAAAKRPAYEPNVIFGDILPTAKSMKCTVEPVIVQEPTLGQIKSTDNCSRQTNNDETSKREAASKNTALATVRAQMEKLRNEAETYQNKASAYKQSSFAAEGHGSMEISEASSAKIAASQAFQGVGAFTGLPVAAPTSKPPSLLSMGPVIPPPGYTPYGKKMGSMASNHMGANYGGSSAVEEEDDWSSQYEVDVYEVDVYEVDVRVKKSAYDNSNQIRAEVYKQTDVLLKGVTGSVPPPENPQVIKAMQQQFAFNKTMNSPASSSMQSPPTPVQNPLTTLQNLPTATQQPLTQMQKPNTPLQKTVLQNPPTPMQNLPTPKQNLPTKMQNQSTPVQKPSTQKHKTLLQNPPTPAQNIPTPMQNLPTPTQNQSTPVQKPQPAPVQNVPTPMQNLPTPMQNQPTPLQKPSMQKQKTLLLNPPAPVQNLTPSPVQNQLPPMQKPPAPVQKPTVQSALLNLPQSSPVAANNVKNPVVLGESHNSVATPNEIVKSSVNNNASKVTKEKFSQTDILVKKLNGIAEKLTTQLSINTGAKWATAPKATDEALMNIDTVLDGALRTHLDLQMNLKKAEIKGPTDKKDFSGGPEIPCGVTLVKPSKDFFNQTDDSWLQDSKIIDQQSKTIEDLVAKLAFLKQEKQATVQKTQEDSSKTNEQTKTIAHLLGQVTSLRNEKDLIQAKNTRIKNKVDQLSEKIKEKEDDLQTFRKRSDDLRIQRDRIEGKLQTYKEESFKLEDENAKMIAKMEGLKQENAALKQENKSLMQQNRDDGSFMEKQKHDIAKLKKCMATKNCKLSKMQLELEKANVELTLTRTIIAPKPDTSNKSTHGICSPDVEALQKEILQLRKSKRTQEKWNEMLKQRVDILLREQSDTQDTEVMLRSTVRLLEEKERILKAAVDKLESRAGRFEELIEQAEIERDTVKLELEAAMCTYESLRNEYDALRKETKKSSTPSESS